MSGFHTASQANPITNSLFRSSGMFQGHWIQYHHSINSEEGVNKST